MEFTLAPAARGRATRSILTEEAVIVIVAFAGLFAAAALSFVLTTWEQKRRTPWEQQQIETAWRDFLVTWKSMWFYFSRLRFREAFTATAETWAAWRAWKHKSPAGRVTTWLMRAALAVAIGAVGWDWPKVILRLIEKWK